MLRVKKLHGEFDFSYCGTDVLVTAEYDGVSGALLLTGMSEQVARALLDQVSGATPKMMKATAPTPAPTPAAVPPVATTTRAPATPSPAAKPAPVAPVLDPATLASLASKPAPTPAKAKKDKPNIVDDAADGAVEPPVTNGANGHAAPPAEVAADEGGDEEGEEEAAPEIPPEVLNARKLRDVLVYYQDQGVKDPVELKRILNEFKPHVVVLKRIDNLDDRIDRQLEVLDTNP